MKRQDRLVKRTGYRKEKSNTATGILALIIVLVVGYGFFRFASYLIHDTSMFTLRQIKVEGNRFVKTEEILQRAHLKMGTHLFRIPVDSVLQRVRQIPYFSGVSVSRSYPSTLIISVQERQPVAYLIDGRTYMVDAEGKILLKKPGMELEGYPLITGLSVKKLLKDRTPLLDALKLVQQVKQVNGDLFELISEIHIQYGKAPRLYLIHGGAEVLLGRRDFPRRIFLLSQLLNRSEIINHLKKIKRIDLRFENRLIVTRRG